MSNLVALVTGGASGLGKAIVGQLLQSGYHVATFDLNPCDIPQAFSLQLDVTDESQAIQGVNDVVDKFGHIDVLVNAAGVIYSKPLLNLMSKQQIRHNYDSFKNILDINLQSVFLITSVVAEQMLMSRVKGRIINISSISAKGSAGQTAYAAAKAGVEAMTKVWAKELGGFGITVNAIAPGFIDTPSTHNALSPEHIRTIKSETPSRKLGQVDNVVQAVLYAIQNDFVNGSILSVDGGLVV